MKRVLSSAVIIAAVLGAAGLQAQTYPSQAVHIVVPFTAGGGVDVLARINREDGTTVVVSLHQVEVAIKYCPRTVALHRGTVVYDGASAALTPALLRELYGAEADEVMAPAATNQATTPTTPNPLYLHRAYVETPAHPVRQEAALQARALS